MGVESLVNIFDEKYYRDLSGGILEAFGKLFFKDMKIFMYPLKKEGSDDIINSDNLKLHPRVKELYKFFKYNGKLVDIKDYDPQILDIYSRKVLKKIIANDKGWEDMLPTGVAEVIKKRKLFGYKGT